MTHRPVRLVRQNGETLQRVSDYKDVVMLLVDPKQGVAAIRAMKPKPSRYVLSNALRFLRSHGQLEAVRDLEAHMLSLRRGGKRVAMVVGETRPFRAQQNRTVGKDGKDEWGPPFIAVPLRTLGVQVRGQVVDVSALDGVIEVRFTRKPAAPEKDGE